MKYIANPVEVEAVRITGTSPKGTIEGIPEATLLTLEDGTTYTATAGQTSRMTPVVGDYVVTQSDGYVYLNPKDVFERKYRLAGLTRLT